ncbi:MAG: hypothetical protein LBO74_12710 [Candidatus Symbiothrix sp.]|jgi:uncharacterized membrane protein|nr:hypothetical protein [Candidatus Symbiothrix sp.]
MKNKLKIPAIVLWTCISISVIVFAVFYYGLATHPEQLKTTIELDILLDWMYLLLGATIVAAVAGIIWSYLKRTR